MARVVFLGTPQAAVPALEVLGAAHDVGLVITQPDRPRGRSGTPQSPPVKESATALGLEVSQPTRPGDIASVMDEAGPFDVGVVVAYGRILRPEVLALPEHGLLNVHFSLLPRWRGAAPVARALMAGDEMTGVTIIKLDEGLDTGPVLTAQAVDIPPEDDAGCPHRSTRRPGSAAPAAKPFLGTWREIWNLCLRPTTAWSTQTRSRRRSGRSPRTLLPRRQSQRSAGSPQSRRQRWRSTANPTRSSPYVIHDTEVQRGRWSVVDGVPVIGFPGGGVELVTLQPPGKKPMSGADWVRGRRSSQGAVS
jgi:methionyl-tRNA formyltransferase